MTGGTTHGGWWAALAVATAGVVLAWALAPAFVLGTLPLFALVARMLLVGEEAPPPPQRAAVADPGAEHRVRGIALQGQGELDGAFEQFRRCPIDDSMLDLLYNLALEFERARRFDRAAMVFHHVAAQQADYRDIRQRIRRAELMVETAAPASDKRMLGRYEIQKEIGKGAMGVVYLGRDPKIGRVVAVKTVALSQEFDPDELAEVKGRFVREAATAGKLTHPHIVTIYDAGESGGLAFIAMELLRGHDLTRHVKPGTLLPVTTVIELVAQAADGLDYAHAQGVVHRDIKPANLVYEHARRTVKITDFGIARITDSSRTRTGLVLGTPSYMAPEQLSGRPFDGRADLYSLGVTAYQLLTGQLPFRADSMASLVQRIATDEPPAASDLRPELPLEIDGIIARAMHKEPDKRYATGADFARALRALHSEEADLWV